MKRAAVTARPGETRAAVLENDRLIDLLILRDDMPEVAGSLYLGRVTSFDAGLDAGFVDIGLERPGILPRKSARRRPNAGDAVAVEVIRAPSAGKGAKLAEVRSELPGDVSPRPPRLLSPAAPLRDMLRRHAPVEIVTESPAAAEILTIQDSEVAMRARAHLGAVPLFETWGIEAEIEALMDPDVPLPGGGMLRIEPVRTLTAVDVDAGGRDARGGAGRLALETNLAAAVELARQVRLRALSGLIVVDFLDIETKAERAQVTDALRGGFEDDPVRPEIGPMRASGLVEMTRRRARRPLHEVLTEPCGRGGGGRIKTAASVAYELLSAVEREARARPGPAWMVSAAPDVVAVLDGSLRAAREEAERRLGARLTLRSEPASGREMYEIAMVGRCHDHTGGR